MANLSLRNLTKKHMETLDRVKRKHQIGTAAGAIARTIEDWDRLRSQYDEMEARLGVAEGLIHDYAAATHRAAVAMVDEEKGMAALVKFDKGTKTIPRQLTAFRD